ncbi:MAG: TIGR04133 family radical SAM/SPASM protein [Dysgonamonadaceae bacterium]|jgi:radical SAM enzyme (rSAM/lipoprotein system)|nr:TIGR04133 family radical SAM/SPASM protein [Dysgonamonadaceae bacterium]
MNNVFSQNFHNFFRRNETELHILNYLFWEATWRCNLNCRHCGSDCKANSIFPDMPFDDFLKAIQPLKTAYPRNSILVVIMGGEPLLRKDLAECGKKLRDEGFRWSIVTNGYAYDKAMHAKLVSAGMGSITVSLDGLEENHNWLRNNPKSFERAVKALELIVDCPRLNYDAVTCVHQKNLAELPGLKEFLISKKIKNWRIFTVAPIGRAAENPEMLLSNEQTRQLMDFIAGTRKNDKRINLYFSCESYTGKYEKQVRDSYFFCRAGVNIGSVLIDGSISACPNIDRRFVQGNIYKDNLLDVWENRFDVMRNRSWCKTGICKNCRDFKLCNGGDMHLWSPQQDGILSCVKNKINNLKTLNN